MKIKSTLPLVAGIACALAFSAANAATKTASPHGHFGAPNLSATANSANGDNFDVVNHDPHQSHYVQIDGWSGTLVANSDPSDPPGCTYCQYSTNIGYWPTMVTIDHGAPQYINQSGPITYVDIYPNNNVTAQKGTNTTNNNVRIVVH